MAPPVRPAFHEGQVLSAADLSAVVGHARDNDARITRSLTTPGIVSGLRLLTVEVQDSGDTVLQARVERGMALDIAGRLVVVAEDQPLGEELVNSIGALTPEAAGSQRSVRYPVFLAAEDQPEAVTSRGSTGCGETHEPTRIREGFRVTIGRPGSELDLDERSALAPDIGADGGGTSAPVLLGFVQLRTNATARFVAVEDVETPGTKVRRAGLRGSEVRSRSHDLSLRTVGGAKPGTPVLVLDEQAQDDSVLKLGLMTASGVDPLVSVSRAGDMRVVGVLTARFKVGDVYVESGIISSGLRLPLPTGTTDADVTDEKVAIHTSVTPELPAATVVGNAFGTVECRVDDDRTVRCRIKEEGGTATDCAARYVVVVTARSDDTP
jgi:hypothetical protein